MLTSACVQMGLQDDVLVVKVDGFRWVLSYEQNPSYPDFGRSMIGLERNLQLFTKRPIDLRLESKEDKNRRIQRNTLHAKSSHRTSS